MTVEEVLYHIGNVYHNLDQKDSYEGDLYRTAIAALYKQIGVKPFKLEGKGKTYVLCPQCSHHFYSLVGGVKIAGGPSPYCERCGQRIDWEEENE